MTQQPDVPLRSDTGESDERSDVLDAMAVYSADGQADDATGNDAAAGAALPSADTPEAEPDREPHGPN
jgi:hypothetical protein